MKNNKIIYKFYAILISLIFANCTSIDNDIKQVTLGELNFNCSSKFKNKSKNKFLYFSSLEENQDKYAYFTVNIINPESSNNISELEILDLMFQSFKNDDTLEFFKKYKMERINSASLVYYFGEFITEINEHEYIYNFLLFKHENVIYEVGMKSLLTDKVKYREMLNSIIYSINIKEVLIFNPTDKVNVEKVELGH